MIVIRDMEMPTRCADCCLCIREDMDTMPFCRLTGEDMSLNAYETKRRDDCPLEEVVKCSECMWVYLKDWHTGVCENRFGLNGSVKPGDFCSRGQRREQVQEHKERRV